MTLKTMVLPNASRWLPWTGEVWLLLEREREGERESWAPTKRKEIYTRSSLSRFAEQEKNGSHFFFFPAQRGAICRHGGGNCEENLNRAK